MKTKGWPIKAIGITLASCTLFGLTLIKFHCTKEAPSTHGPKSDAVGGNKIIMSTGDHSDAIGGDKYEYHGISREEFINILDQRLLENRQFQKNLIVILYTSLLQMQNSQRIEELVNQTVSRLKDEFENQGKSISSEEIKQIVMLLHESNVIEQQTFSKRFDYLEASVSYLTREPNHAKEMLERILVLSPNDPFSAELMKLIEAKLDAGRTAMLQNKYEKLSASLYSELDTKTEKLALKERQFNDLQKAHNELDMKYRELQLNYKNLNIAYQRCRNRTNDSEPTEPNLSDTAPPTVAGFVPQPQVYYVNMTGQDSDPGTSNNPWQTVTRALSQLQSGDVLEVGIGIYNFSFQHWNSLGRRSDINVLTGSRDLYELSKRTEDRTLVLTPGIYRLPILADDPNTIHVVWVRVPKSWENIDQACEDASKKELWALQPGKYNWTYLKSPKDVPRNFTMKILSPYREVKEDETRI